MRYVENEGALFRIAGPSNAFPTEVWSEQQKKFVPYQGDVPKPQGWGEDVDEAEAQRIMAGESASQQNIDVAAATSSL